MVEAFHYGCEQEVKHQSWKVLKFQFYGKILTLMDILLAIRMFLSTHWILLLIKHILFFECGAVCWSCQIHGWGVREVFERHCGYIFSRIFIEVHRELSLSLSLSYIHTHTHKVSWHVAFLWYYGNTSNLFRVTAKDF